MNERATTDMQTAPRIDEQLYRDVERFLFLEARLQDTHAYDEWEALWADDGTYWIPANGDDTDPETQMSIVYDNRSRIRLRVEQLNTGRRHSQAPPSRLARSITNIELVGLEHDLVTVLANVFIYEDNLRGETIWAARNRYVLRIVGGGFQLVHKKVALVNNHKPVYTLAFLV